MHQIVVIENRNKGGACVLDNFVVPRGGPLVQTITKQLNAGILDTFEQPHCRIRRAVVNQDQFPIG
jgi:hypothetical protein